MVTLGDVVEIKGGGTPSKANSAYWNGDIPWVSPKDMKFWDIEDAIDKITSDAIKGSATNLVPESSILIVNRSGILKHTLPVGITRRPVAINQDIKALICGERCHPDYIAHLVKAAEPTILKWVRATTADNFSIENLRSLEIPLPPLDEQRRIAAILDKANALRRKRKHALDLLDSLTNSLFLDVFGDPLSNPKHFPVSAFEQLLELPPNFGSMIPPKTDALEWVSLRVANIQNWALTLADTKYIDLPPDSVDRHTLRDGDIILARAIASEEHLGKCVVVRPAGRKWAFDSHLMRIRLNTQKIDPVYVRELFRTPGGARYFFAPREKQPYNTTSTQKN
jgi:type I restriction enzyme S subunit